VWTLTGAVLAILIGAFLVWRPFCRAHHPDHGSGHLLCGPRRRADIGVA
jgi:hypothetical protein